MRTLALFVAILSAPVARGQGAPPQTEQPSSQNRTVQVPQQAQPVHVEQSAPRSNVVAFLSMIPGQGGLALFRAPDGTGGTIPISEVKRALEAGYRPITVGDLVDAADADQKLVQNLQKRYSDLASDYDALVARYNRLAAINAAPPAAPQGASNDQLIRMLALQSLFKRSPAPIQIQVTDCTAYPALCVH
jgi:hypothetical protein